MSFDPFGSNDDKHSYVPVFDWLLELDNITLTDALLYGLLARYQKGEHGEAKPSLATLCAKLGCDRRDLQRRLRKLEGAGLIQRQEVVGKPSVFVFLRPPGGRVKYPRVPDPPMGVSPAGQSPATPAGETPAPGAGEIPAQVDERVDERVDDPSGKPDLRLAAPESEPPKPRKLTPLDLALADERVREVVAYFREYAKPHRAWSERAKSNRVQRAVAVAQCLERGFTVDDIKTAIRVVTDRERDPERAAGNGDLELICREGKTETYLQAAERGPIKAQGAAPAHHYDRLAVSR